MTIARTIAAALPAAALSTTLALGLVSMDPGHAHADGMDGSVAAGMGMTDHTMMTMKTPTCGCCAAWIDLARREGFEVEVTDTEDYEGMKALAGVPEPMWSCHTTRIDGYTVEGHVPFAAVRRLLDERPAISGIAVPGMPMGSPGMGDDPNARFDVTAYGGEAKPGEVFFRAGLDGAGADGIGKSGWFGRLFGSDG